MKFNIDHKKIFESIDKYLILVFVFLYPLFFLPVFSNNFEVPKLLLLVVFTLIISAIKIVRILSSGNFKLKISKIDLLVLGVSLTYILSTIFVTPNKMDAILLPGTTSFIVFGAILYFFINQFEEKTKNLINISLSLSATVLGIVQILSFTGIIKDNFNNFGNIINTFSFLLAVLAISIYQTIKNKNIQLRVFYAITSFIVFISAFVSIYSILPGKATSINLPSLKTTWSVAVDSLKQSPLLGVGPSNFLYSYSKFRPITVNQTNIWSAKYIVGSNYMLTMLAEVGIIGFVLFISLFIFSLSKFKELNTYKIGLLIIFVISLIYPFSPAFLPIIFMFFALNNNAKETSGFFNSKIPLFLMFLPIIGILVATVYGAYITFYPEYIFGNALKFVTKNEAINAYETTNKAVNLNKYVDRYHLASAEINIAIAQDISQKENLTDDEKKTLAELIQQAIREGKAAVALNPTKSASWESLGNIYVAITSYAKEAGTFATQSYNQAIFLDPTNPNLRIKLGGIYYSDGKYEEAAKVFELAVLAKPDLANAHFNLAMAYKALKQTDKAKEQMNLVLKLIDPNSNDYQLVKKELDSIGTKTETPVETKKEESPIDINLNPTDPTNLTTDSPVTTDQQPVDITQ